MRVIGGQYRSRVLTAPTGWNTRPSSDRLRETLFNVLAPRIEGADFVDLYAGSGAVGIEALSRGAREAIFVEQAQAAVKAIRANLATLGIREGYALEACGVGMALRKLSSTERTADIIFLDPPYERANEYEATLGQLGGECSSILAPGAIVIAEYAKKNELEEQYGALVRYRVLRQGDAALGFYSSSAE
jgi:16S rRNA (guanine966-N2)-methyltransferase